MSSFGYQLYSSRNFTPLVDTLRLLASIGYEEIEGYGALFQDTALLQELQRAMTANGLRMPTAHLGLEFVRQSPDEAIALCRQFGIKTVFFPYLADQDRPIDAPGWTDFGKTLAQAGKPLLDAGLAFGWHNHDFELADLGGTDTPLDLILHASDELLLELDVAWIVRGGRDPLDFIRRYKDRIRAVHIKDIAPDGMCLDEDGWADVGHGTLNWPSLFAALQDTGVQHFIMEHDNPSDHARFARRSFEAVTSIGKES